MQIEITYSKEDRLWTVGIAADTGRWTPLRDCSTQDEAIAFINYLHGGTGESFDWQQS